MEKFWPRKTGLLYLCHMVATALPEQFWSSKSFIFPKRKFGARGEEWSFRAEWCQENDWLHYDVDKDAAFCYLCMKCEHEKKFLSSKKREPALISKGYTYWKEASTAFKKHWTSDCHREAVKVLLVLPQCTNDIAELQSVKHVAQKSLNHHFSGLYWIIWGFLSAKDWL